MRSKTSLTSMHKGICVKESQNCTIINSISRVGIRIISSSNCLIKNNTCKEDEGGIYLENSNFCEILGNSIKNTYDFGIKLADSINCSLEDNYLQYCIYGIVIKNSINSTILDNRFRRAIISFEDYSKMTFETITISNNSLEVEVEEIWQNKEIVLFRNLKNYVFPDTDYGQIILFNCSSLIFDNLYYPKYGIYELVIYQCEKITFLRNNVKGRILLCNSTESSINSNEINRLKIEECSEISIENNKIRSMELYNSSQISIINNSNDLHLQEMFYTWLYISKCYQIDIQKNEFKKNYCGIFARESSSLKIYNNSIAENFVSPIYIEEIDFKWFIHGGSIELFDVTNSFVIENNLTEGSDGIFLLKSLNNLVANNTISYYGSGISLYVCSTNNSITSNVIRKNSNGIDIDHSDYSNIKNNTIEENKYGIDIYESNYCNISLNIINKNERGIRLIEDCMKNKIIYNKIEENEIGVYLHSKTEENILHHNYFFNNTQQAIDDSGKNTWYEISTEEGNFWSNHNSKKPYEIEGEGEAIDPYPLNENLERLTRVKFPTIIFLSLCLMSLILIRNKKIKKVPEW